MPTTPRTRCLWRRCGGFLAFTERDILQDAGKISAETARLHAQSEFEKYRIVQDRLFESDFDRVMQQLANKQEPGEH